MILSNASLVRSPGRFVAALRHLAAALVVVAFASGTASAQWQFCTVSNDPGTQDDPYVAIGEAQLGLNVTAVGTNQVAFTFTNTGTANGYISDIYFYDGTLLTGTPSLTHTGDVSFASPANPANLASFSTSLQRIYSFGATNPQTQDGVNPGETLTITLNGSYTDVLAALNRGNTTGGLVIGVKYQGIGTGSDTSGSESYITCVPEPASVVMLGMSSLVGLGYGWRRRKQAVA